MDVCRQPPSFVPITFFLTKGKFYIIRLANKTFLTSTGTFPLSKTRSGKERDTLATLWAATLADRLIKNNKTLFRWANFFLHYSTTTPNGEIIGIVLLIAWTATRQSDSAVTSGHPLSSIQLNASFIAIISAISGIASPVFRIVFSGISSLLQSRATNPAPKEVCYRNTAASKFTVTDSTCGLPKNLLHPPEKLPEEGLHSVYFGYLSIV